MLVLALVGPTHNHLMSGQLIIDEHQLPLSIARPGCTGEALDQIKKGNLSILGHRLIAEHIWNFVIEGPGAEIDRLNLQRMSGVKGEEFVKGHDGLAIFLTGMQGHGLLELGLNRQRVVGVELLNLLISLYRSRIAILRFKSFSLGK